MNWITSRVKPAEELVEKIDEVMEPYRKTTPDPDAAKRTDEWEEALLAKARTAKAKRERFMEAAEAVAKAAKACGIDPCDVAIGLPYRAIDEWTEFGFETSTHAGVKLRYYSQALRSWF